MLLSVNEYSVRIMSDWWLKYFREKHSQQCQVQECLGYLVSNEIRTPPWEPVLSYSTSGIPLKWTVTTCCWAGRGRAGTWAGWGKAGTQDFSTGSGLGTAEGLAFWTSGFEEHVQVISSKFNFLSLEFSIFRLFNLAILSESLLKEIFLCFCGWTNE